MKVSYLKHTLHCGPGVGRIPKKNCGRFPFDQKFRKFRVGGSEWNKDFPEFHSEILGVPPEVGLKSRKIGVPQASKHNISALSDKGLKNLNSAFIL